MSIAMYLSIPGVTGECQVTGFSSWIDIYSYSVGASNPTTVGTGTGSGAGKVSISSFQISKSIDSSTPSLFLTCCQGTHYGSAEVQVLEAGGTSPVVFLKIDFTQVFVDTISWGGSSGGGKPSEAVSFSFASIQFTYTPQLATGGGGSPIPCGWNLMTGVSM